MYYTGWHKSYLTLGIQKSVLNLFIASQLTGIITQNYFLCSNCFSSSEIHFSSLSGTLLHLSLIHIQMCIRDSCSFLFQFYIIQLDYWNFKLLVFQFYFQKSKLYVNQIFISSVGTSQPLVPSLPRVTLSLTFSLSLCLSHFI